MKFLRRKSRWQRVYFTYTALDGEVVRSRAWVRVEGDKRAGLARALDLLRAQAAEIIEDAKRNNYWPLPPDHPNAPVV